MADEAELTEELFQLQLEFGDIQFKRGGVDGAGGINGDLNELMGIGQTLDYVGDRRLKNLQEVERQKELRYNRKANTYEQSVESSNEATHALSDAQNRENTAAEAYAAERTRESIRALNHARTVVDNCEDAKESAGAHQLDCFKNMVNAGYEYRDAMNNHDALRTQRVEAIWQRVARQEDIQRQAQQQNEVARRAQAANRFLPGGSSTRDPGHDRRDASHQQHNGRRGRHR